MGMEKLGNGRLSPILTKEGGIGFWFINKTGLPSVKGTILDASLLLDLAVGIEGVGAIDPIGVMYSNGIADGLPVLVIISGIAEVLLDDGTGSTRGNWGGTSDTTAGRGQSSINPPGTPQHDQEIGHCMETVAPGVDVLAKFILHFR